MYIPSHCSILLLVMYISCLFCLRIGLFYGITAGLCFINTILASTWSYTFGILFSSIFFIIFTGITYANYRHVFCINKYLSGSACWKLAIQMSLLFISFWIALMVLIHFMGSTPGFTTRIPDSCAKPGCTRIASAGQVTRAGELYDPPVIASSYANVMTPLVEFMEGLTYTVTEEQDNNFARFRTLSAMLGFPDDTGVQLLCKFSKNQTPNNQFILFFISIGLYMHVYMCLGTNQSEVEVWIYASLRIGSGDMDVNVCI